MNVDLGVQPVGNFSGTVNIACSVDFGGTCTGGSVLVSGPGTNPVDVVVSVPAGTATGAHTLTVTASDGSLVHTSAFPFYVADFTGSLSQSSLTMAAGGSATLTGRVEVTTGFEDSVSLACTGSIEITCTFSPANISPTATNPQTTTTTVTASSTASLRASDGDARYSLRALSIMFPLGILVVLGRRVKSRYRGFFFFLAMTLSLLSCGGGGGTGTVGGGSNSYNITVNATPAGTNTTRALGTIIVTVSH